MTTKTHTFPTPHVRREFWTVLSSLNLGPHRPGGFDLLHPDESGYVASESRGGFWKDGF